MAGSAYSGADEVASGFAASGNKLIVQACRRGQRCVDRHAERRLHADQHGQRSPSVAGARGHANLARKNELTGLGLDLTEHGGPGFVEVVLHGAADAGKLVDNNFAYTTVVPDLAAQAAAGPRGRRALRGGERRIRAAERPRPPTGACSTTART